MEPWFRWAKERARRGEMWKRLAELVLQEPGYLDALHAEVRERGPLSAGELRDPRPQAGDWWGSRSLGTWGLDALWRLGRLGVRRVGNFEKQFDLFENVVPAEVRARPTPSAKFNGCRCAA